MKKNPIRNTSDNSSLFSFEEKYWKMNKLICGVDEVGRGCLAGPVVTAAAILHPKSYHPFLSDSKLLSKAQLQKVFIWAIKNCTYSIGISNARIIDKQNIYNATKITMKKALYNILHQQIPDIILIDAMPLQLEKSSHSNIPIESWIKGETKSASIAVASVIAKVTRDTILTNMSKAFPVYNLQQHKGYGTKFHNQALKTHQASIIHRQTFLKNLKGTALEQHTQQNLFC